MALNQYSTNPLVTASSAGSGTALIVTGIKLPFEANSLLIINDGSPNVYFSVASTVASTSDIYLKQAESVHFHERYIIRLGLASTSTSTGGYVRVGAWLS